MPTDLELLEIQEGSVDAAGRIAGFHGVTIVWTRDRQALWIGAEVPEALAAELRAAFEAAAPTRDPAQPPPALEPCRKLLEAGGRPLSVRVGPSFLIPHDVRFPSQLPIVRSDVPLPSGLRDANPGNWPPVEWQELLEGRQGPWTMAFDGKGVLSICHTPVSVTARSAECGVWTDPAVRGRGFGAAVTAEWAALMRRPGRHLFYSTELDNRSSQRLAERLGLRPLGWTWRLTPRPVSGSGSVHR
jgi:hypothetical protein